MTANAGSADTGPGERHAVVVPKARDGGVPLSWEQEQIWLHAMQFPDLPLYTETLTIHYRGELNIPAFASAVDEVRQRHEILRSAVVERHGVPQLVVRESEPLIIELFDLAKETEEARASQISALLSRFAREPLSLQRGPLMRVFAVRYSNADTRIFLTLHHLVFDGASLRQVLLPELLALYENKTIQHQAHLAPPRMQYAEYVRWQRDQDTAPLESAMAFWRQNLTGLSPLSLPVDRPRPQQVSRRGGVHLFSFDQPLTDAVLETGKTQRTTVFSVLLASFIALLARYADTQDVTLGTVYGGRPRTEFESVMGCFQNFLLLRTDLTGDPTFSDLLTQVRAVTLDALENVAAPFHEVVRRILPASSGTANGEPPVQAVFSFQPPSAALPPNWDLDVFDVFNGCAKFDLHLEIEQKNGIFRGRLMYSSDLFDTATIEDMTRHWLRLLQAAVHEPDKTIWKLPLLTAAEQSKVLHPADLPASVPSLCVHDLFAKKAAETPESIAIQYQGESLTYEQLENWSASIASLLCERGVGRESVIAVMVERSPAMLAGLLGILRAGAAYVPLDPTYPAARLEHMLQASGASLLLTQSHLSSNLPVSHPNLLEIASCETEQSSVFTARSVEPADTAYILFTSGSTGLPKGVEIPHSALTNLLWSMRETPGIEAEDKLLAVTSISFDIAALELFLPLIVGACVVMARSEETTDPALLAKKIAQSSITMMQATPATWRMLIDAEWTPVQPLKVLCGGEALPLNLAEDLLSHCSSVWNMYGPTETTIWSTCAELNAGATTVPLGNPIMNTTLYVLDSHQMLLPAGVSGELYIGGAGLANGYRGQPDLTRERFPVVSVAGREPARLYRTGDRVKRRRDGSLHFLGRTDSQIKLHGFRIELGEIEHILNSLPGVRESAVVLAHHTVRKDLLAAFVVPKAGVLLQVEDLRARMAQQLPASMQPSVIRVLDEVPLTLNGKLDRNRLPSIEDEEESPVFELPLSGIEQTLAVIWRDILGLKTIGRRDNFFDSGGRSLEALRCLSQINRTLGVTIAFASFIQGPSIAQLAQVVREGSAPKVQLLKQGHSMSKRLLWIGAEPWLTRFADHLSNGVTLYTVTPDLNQLTSHSIEAMAAQILSNVKELQGDGPYLLGGFCLRSLLAFEVAQKLLEEGAEVGLLVLGDVYATGRTPKWSVTERIIRRIHRESWKLLNALRSPSPQRTRELRRLVSSWGSELFTRAGDPWVPDEFLQALYVAESHYEMSPFIGRVLFLESGESRLFGGSRARTWQGFIEGPELLCYPGIHENLFQDSQLSVFAKRIEEAMDSAVSTSIVQSTQSG